MNRQLCMMLCILISSILKADRNEELTFLQQFIKPGDLVFDVGAHIGKKTDYYLACGAHVVCIEPQPHCIATLNQRFRLESRVHIEPVGLADRAGSLTLSICSQAPTISTFSEEWQKPGTRFPDHGYTWDRKLEVKVTTLDQLIAIYGLPVFCKIDVENFEYSVLRGLSQPITYLSFEFAIEILHNTKQCIAYLEKLGYTKFNFAIAEYSTLALNDWVDGDTLILKIEQTSREHNWNHIWALWGDVYAYYDDNHLRNDA